MKLTSAQLDRAAGLLLGMACGDALGAGYEFGPRWPTRTRLSPRPCGHAIWTDRSVECAQHVDNGRPAAVLVSPERNEVLMIALEDSEDIAVFDSAMEDEGANITWEQVKADTRVSRHTQWLSRSSWQILRTIGYPRGRASLMPKLGIDSLTNMRRRSRLSVPARNYAVEGTTVRWSVFIRR